MESTNPKGMETMILQKIDGVVYPCALGTPDMVQQLSVVRDLDIRDDDVIIVGIPKMGNHWLFEVTGMITRKTTNFSKEQYIHHCIDYIGSDVGEKIAKFESPRVLAMHAFIDKLPKQALEKKVKILFPLRNPKDVWASGYHMYSTLDHKPLHFSGTWDEYFNLRMRGEFIFDTWFENVKSVERFKEEHPDIPLHVHLFEHAKLDSNAAMRELSKFLGGPTELADQIAEVTAFKNMKKALENEKMGDLKKEVFKEGQTGIMRKGEIGDWKNRFTVAQSQAFDELFEREMKDSKLGNLVRPYI